MHRHWGDRAVVLVATLRQDPVGVDLHLQDIPAAGEAGDVDELAVQRGPVDVGPTASGSSTSMPVYAGGLSGTVLLGVVVALIVIAVVATVVALTRRRTSA